MLLGPHFIRQLLPGRLIYIRRLRNALHLPEYLHEFLAGNRLFLNQEFRNLIHHIPVLGKQLLGFLVGLLQDSHYLLVHFRRRSIATV